jgi:AAA family ATP:ADP antiporter
MAVAGEAAQEAYIGAFYADFYFWVNVLGAVLQMFAVSRIMKYFGVRAALIVLPTIALAKIAENSADYSIQNTARHALFLRTNREAKYKAKTAIDSFFWRAGDALSALLVFVGTYLAFDIRHFALVNLLLVGVWLLIAVRLRRVDAQVKTASSASNEAQPEAA